MTELLPASPLALAAAMLITFVAAAVQGTIGFGFAIVAVPILSLIDPRLAPVPQMLVTLPLTISMALRERHALELRGATWVLVGCLPGSVLGVLLLKSASGRTLDVIIGLLVLGAAAVIATGARVPRTRTTELGAGILSGIGGIVSAISGPPIALLYGGDRGPTIRANLAAIFSVGLVVTVTARSLAGEVSANDVQVTAFLILPLVLGYRASKRLLARIEGAPLRRGVVLVSALAALGLLGRAVFTG